MPDKRITIKLHLIQTQSNKEQIIPYFMKFLKIVSLKSSQVSSLTDVPCFLTL